MKLRRPDHHALSAAVFTVATALVLTGCGSATGSDGSGKTDPSEVTLVVGTPNRAGLHRALLASGEGENTPYKIKYADFDSTQPLTEALRTGRVDIAAGGETGVLFAMANRSEIKVLAATRESRLGGSAILVRKGSPIRDLAQLKGKTIALPYYTHQHYQLAVALKRAGLSWHDVKVVNLDTAAGSAALNGKHADAFVVWDPNTAIAQTQQHARVLKPLKPVIDPPGMLYAPSAALDDPSKKAALRDLTRRVIRANAWVNKHPEEWAKSISRLSGIPLAAARLQVSRSRSMYEPVDKPTVAAWQKEVDYFKDLGQIPSAPVVKDSVQWDFAPVVEKAAAASDAGQGGR
ncbi:ABC transporter substrate-binding protein [Streptomyces violaceusniger]|uniref:ABC transporter substrate-binding protein n=1 Tax=Streptomyces violaceusniger TaxID=68280 RepID=UPI0031CEF93E